MTVSTGPRHDGVEVEMPLRHVRQRREVTGQRRVLARLHQAQMALRQAQRGVAWDGAQHRRPHRCLHRVAVPGAADAVEHDAADPHRRVKAGQAVRHGGGGLRLAGHVQHQQHRQAEPGGEVGGGAGAAGWPGDAVEQAHRALDDEQIAARGFGEQSVQQRRRHRPTVQVDAGRAGGRGVERGGRCSRGRPLQCAPPRRGGAGRRPGPASPSSCRCPSAGRPPASRRSC